MNAAKLDEAYAFCRKVAKQEAKNFYYAFRVLPKAKSDAMCAIYAFMRRADDIADDESLPVSDRLQNMSRWLDAWRATRLASDHASQQDVSDPVFWAVRDTQLRFHISDDLLEDLVRGTTMDLEPCSGAPGSSIDIGEGLQGYQDFRHLDQYCYLVASVVGLVCIRIFGYEDAAAEALAEKTGTAFQLTNILRDVKEDAERRRIYLPQELLRSFDVSNEDILALCAGRPLRENERAMIASVSAQTARCYEAAQALLPLIHSDSRAALWVLVAIYRELLRRIDRRRGGVFCSRVSVPAVQKLLILARGLAMSRGTPSR